MNVRPALFATALLIPLAPAVAAAEPTPAAGEARPVPVPPVPPRIAEGQDYERCLAMLAKDPRGANAFAEAWEATGGAEGAAHCQALAQITLGNPGAGAQMLDKLAAETGRASARARAQVYGQAVQAWLMDGQPDRAHASASRALALKPDDADLLVDRSIAAGTMGRYMDAIDDLNRVLLLEPRRPDALVFRAAAERHEERLDKAQADIDLALRLDPGNIEALLERGILRQRRGDNDGARADWRRVMEQAPDSAAADLAQQNLALLEAGPGRR